ncbi:MAG TPA: hypothetical protein PKJ32_06925, partial [Piscinibacter sp.]|nr:hypothetical protein [Piscinibacter sp.]
SLSPDAIDPRLAWDADYLRQFDWLADLADVPDDASPPVMMTPVPADAVGSYGWLAIPWIEKVERKTLRWWQRLSLVRQLEFRADGSLCHRRKIESAPRRAGKSVGLRGGALWRMEHGERPLSTPFGEFVPFGEVQTVIHTGSDMAICREIQRGAWRWAEGVGWTVTKGNGKEAVETPEGARWLVRAQDAVYGYDVCLGMVDESWDVKPDTVSEGIDPATLERCNPQVVLTSTAHRRATSLMRSELTAAMALEDPETLLLLWAAPLGSDASDPAVWRAASPHWTEDRHRLIAGKYRKALAGEVDPEADDPDPMKGFEAQYLNIWRIREPRQVGRPVVDQESWRLLAVEPPDERPDVVAIEGWFDQGVSVARAWETDAGVVVSVAGAPDVVSAAALVASYRCAGTVLVGSSLAPHPAWLDEGLSVEPVSQPLKAAAGEFALAIKEKRFHHARSGLLTEQALALRVADGADGVRVVSKERSDAVKAAAWAVRQASSAYDVMQSML